MKNPNFSFDHIPQIDNESETAFSIMFFKESGKLYSIEYFTANKALADYYIEHDTANVYEMNDYARTFAENYPNYRYMTAVIVPSENSCILPHLITANHRR